jgi:glutaminyl-peptide cyclotransferase
MNNKRCGERALLKRWRRSVAQLILSASALGVACDDPYEQGPTIRDQPPESYTYQILNRYPHDPSAFTQGLSFTEGRLFEGTGLIGASSIREVEVTTGEVKRALQVPDVFGEGITLMGQRLYQLTWRAGRCYVYDRDTFAIIDTLRYHTEGWGLTHDDTYLIMSDGSPRLSFRDPMTFREVRWVTVTDSEGPVYHLNELEYLNGRIYANIFKSATLAIINPQSGVVEGWLDLSGLSDDEGTQAEDEVLNGIAYDEHARRFFVTGKRWSTLYELEVVTP